VSGLSKLFLTGLVHFSVELPIFSCTQLVKSFEVKLLNVTCPVSSIVFQVVNPSGLPIIVEFVTALIVSLLLSSAYQAMKHFV
jgi:hypothetical protein